MATLYNVINGKKKYKLSQSSSLIRQRRGGVTKMGITKPNNRDNYQLRYMNFRISTSKMKKN